METVLNIALLMQLIGKGRPNWLVRKVEAGAKTGQRECVLNRSDEVESLMDEMMKGLAINLANRHELAIEIVFLQNSGFYEMSTKQNKQLGCVLPIKIAIIF